LFACISWGSLTALMLYVKLRKKIEAFPVLILIVLFMAYMNAGDLLATRSKLYTVACVNRRVFATQFLSALMLGFASNAYPDVLVSILLVAAIMRRTNWSIGQTGIPLIGSFLISPRRKTTVFLGIAFQCLGFFTGSVLSISMIDESVTPSFPSFTLSKNLDDYRIVIGFLVLLVLSQIVTTNLKTRGGIQTACATGLVASLSRLVPIYSSSPLILLPVIMVLSRLFPGAVVSISTFVPELVGIKTMTNSQKFRACLSVMIWHLAGALIANYLCDMYLCARFNEHEIAYVPKRGIAQEFFFSLVLGLVGNTVPGVVFAAGWLASGNSGDLAHLSSAISLGARGLSDGRLLARLIWQTAGSLLGATWIKGFVDSDQVDFNPLVSVTRTTDGKRIREQ
jgi:hypothetical protein